MTVFRARERSFEIIYCGNDHLRLLFFVLLFAAVMPVSAQQIFVLNSSFDTDVAGWNGSRLYSPPPDSMGSFASGSMSVTQNAPNMPTVASGCKPVPAGMAELMWEGMYRNPAELQLRLVFRSGCVGAGNESLGDFFFPRQPEQNSWHAIVVRHELPPGTVFVQMQLTQISSGGSFSVDEIGLGSSLLFTGFE